MADIQTEEGWHTLEDGHKLYTKTWKVNTRLLNDEAQRLTRIYVDERDAKGPYGLRSRLQ